MKTIKLPKHASFEVKLDGSVYDTHKVRENHIAYTENAREVIFSAATIERMLKDYVTNFFVADEGKKELFRGVVILSDSFSFRHSIRAVMEILDSRGVEKKQSKELEELLLKVMDYRNALTHGHPIQKHDKFVCQYYKNKQREDEITDAYWETAETTFHRAYGFVEKLP
jgi:hypothetical protein